MAKTFGVSDYKGFNDLMDKIVEQSKNRPDEDEIKRLKSKIVEIETEKEKAVSEAIENGNKRFIEG